MLLTKAELNLARLVSKEEGRFALHSIAVDKNETVVTNGHYLVRVAHSECKDENWPQATAPVEMAHVNDEPMLIHRDAALAASKALPRKTNIPVLAHAALSQDSTLHVNPLEEVKGEFPSQVEGRFINWKQVMPRGERVPAVVIGLDADYIVALAKFIAAHGNKRKTIIKLTVWDKDSAILMESKTEYGQDVQAVLMPCQFE